MTVEIIQGDCREVLRTLPERSVQTCVTSPPYWGLRDYKLPSSVWAPSADVASSRAALQERTANCAHEWGEETTGTEYRPQRDNSGGLVNNRIDSRGEQAWTAGTGTGGVSQGAFCRLCGAWRGTLGLEPTPELYVEHMVAVFREIRRVLRDDGTVWLNLGDSYTSGGRETFGPVIDGHKQATHPEIKNTPRAAQPPGLKPKDLCGIPWRVAFALQADGWWLRSDIVWSKPNPMPESVRDRPTRSHEYVFLLSKKSAYYYDADAIREPGAFDPNGVRGYREGNIDNGHRPSEIRGDGSGFAGRNKRTVWEIATQPYPDAHFATFPEALVKPCILAGTSERGCCAECGAPWERVTELPQWYKDLPGNRMPSGNLTEGVNAGFGAKPDSVTKPVMTLGWRPTCAHEGEPVPCVVLDPFGGSGTVGVVARKAGRRAILIELSKEYCEMARKRFAQAVLL